jgi:hypothetical protein
MTHVDEGTLLAYLDEEASEAQRTEVAGHVATCGSCARELQRLREFSGEVNGVLTTLDIAAPVARAKVRFDEARRDLAAEDRSAAAVQRERGRGRGFSPAIRRGLLQAAALALVLAGVAGAAIPGSPLRAWIANAIDALRGEDASPEVVAPAPAPTVAPETVAEPAAAPPRAPEVDVSIPPDEGLIRIILHEPPIGAQLRIRMTDGAEARLRTTGTARSGAGRIEALEMGSGTIDIELPRTATVATVAFGDQVVLRAESGRFIETPGDATVNDSEVILRIRP